MESEDVINLPASCNSGYKSENDGVHDSICEPCGADSQLSNSEVKEGKLKGEISRTSEVDVGHGVSQPFVAADTDGNLIGSSSFLQASVELNETVSVAKDEKRFSFGIQTENGCRTVQDGSPISNRKRGGSPINNHEIDGGSISEVKKARMTVDEHQPSVHVTYNSLTRDSKRKLEELLLQWSEWHTQNCSSCHDSSEVLESGEETYFPALRLGLDNPSSVSFWMDDQTRNHMGREYIALDSKSVPLYDRGYSLEGGLEIVDASRCFNCGSYNHSLKDCPKPRDNKALNNARNQHKSRRNQNASSRNPTRYYQNSPKGKYDGLKPGVLDAETQKLLGLGELDPPPWLNRMREIGYPPGYLDAEYEDQPSGIMIFADEENKKGEDGEISETNRPEPPKKMSVEFPGINAPIPENADERRWTSGLSSSSSSRNRSHHRLNPSLESISRSQHHEQRLARDFRDEGPPGVDPAFSPTLSSYSPRYGSYHYSFTSQYAGGSNISTPRSPSLGRSLSDRGRSPLFHEGYSSNPGSHSSLPYLSPNQVFSPPSYSSASFERRVDESRNAFSPNFSSHHHHSRSRGTSAAIPPSPSQMDDPAPSAQPPPPLKGYATSCQLSIVQLSKRCLICFRSLLLPLPHWNEPMIT
ncbi:uncharacterized protein LOC130786137 isoform X3 [Actinidia eriantha]|uniref:uncharacterized protein LOC130786137 isoform X3 n=1 Tax=Actinidia eriantha TaxID=165200 RepID=UPI00258DC6C4|nr:uncharacterized protein LOC130786137 isoform X3 [Actinidia eriantha]